ncbi:hypothetical protein EKO23_09255 [Nocardioides guangzhouensis]|uniref:Uncharacterized protein n=1 Tax=Nocardioides guangzhouensis TaxID=2497878 RepID=A0A4V1XZE6_9ACTN|nr:hypothetical protein [Nocardioides guangzhouensis]RYP86479.1 hypothetical protein EKO23_09255 [Nocardioides guangzhouensis]
MIGISGRTAAAATVQALVGLAAAPAYGAAPADPVDLGGTPIDGRPSTDPENRTELEVSACEDTSCGTASASASYLFPDAPFGTALTLQRRILAAFTWWSARSSTHQTVPMPPIATGCSSS